MRRPRRALAAALLLAAAPACTVERTPPEYYQERDPSVVEQQEAEDEVRTRIGAFRAAMERGDRLGAVAALNPQPLARVLGPDGPDEVMGLGAAGVDSALAALPDGGPSVVRFPDVAVEVSLREGVGWFASHLVLLPTTDGREAVRLRMSGVFTRDRGDWRLVQLHLSRPAADPAPAGTATADSSAPPPSPPSDGAPPGDG